MTQSVETATPTKRRNPVLRAIFFVLGLISLALIPLSFLPMIPTFDLVLLAAFFFSMSSDKMHDWMLNHRYFGRIIRGYRENGLTMRMKWIAAVSIVGSLALSGIFLTDNTMVRVILSLVGVYAVWFVFSRPTWERERS